MFDSIEERLRSKTRMSTDLRLGGDRVSMYGITEAKRIWWTLDIHLLPFVSLLYLMSFL
jgi:hypothetical protein